MKRINTNLFWKMGTKLKVFWQELQLFNTFYKSNIITKKKRKEKRCSMNLTVWEIYIYLTVRFDINVGIHFTWNFFLFVICNHKYIKHNNNHIFIILISYAHSFLIKTKNEQTQTKEEQKHLCCNNQVNKKNNKKHVSIIWL